MSTATAPAGLLASMLIYGTRTADEKVTFKLLPLTAECPYAEVEFDSTAGVLCIISRHQQQEPKLLQRLDDKGRLIKVGTDKDTDTPLYAQQRVTMTRGYEYYLRDARDIEQFMALVAFNLDHQVYQYFLQASREASAAEAQPASAE